MAVLNKRITYLLTYNNGIIALLTELYLGEGLLVVLLRHQA